jgi:hypothetical protein
MGHMMYLISLGLAFLALFVPHTSAFFEAVEDLKRAVSTDTSSQNPVSGLDTILSEMSLAPSTTFQDVHTQDWFHPSVTLLAELGIVSGYKDAAGNATGMYGPANRLTVAEFLKMTLESARTDETLCTAAPVHPGAAKHWARAYVSCGEAIKMRLLSYNPPLDRSITRAEALTLIHDAWQVSVPQMTSTFTDSQRHIYERDIAFAATVEKIVTGDTYPDGHAVGTFRPNSSLNRAEAAALIERTLNLFIERLESGAIDSAAPQQP